MSNFTRLIIGCAMGVHRELGCGYLELVYERALEIELKSKGIRVERQVSLPVTYKGQLVGNFVADMVVAGCLIIELKATESTTPRDEAQLINYLKAANIPLGLLFNFGQQSLKTKRLVHHFDEGQSI
jgi:GxxExxY protein